MAAHEPFALVMKTVLELADILHSGMPLPPSCECDRAGYPIQARETCVLCCKLLDRACFWPEQWRHRRRNNIKMKCQECSPICPKGQPTGYLQLNEQRSREAAAKPFTCQVCERTLPRTQFRIGKNGNFHLRISQTCEQCRAEGKLPMKGWKKRRL